MVALFHHLALTHHDDLVGVDDSGETMSHEDHGGASLGDETIDGLLYLDQHHIIVVRGLEQYGIGQGQV